MDIGRREDLLCFFVCFFLGLHLNLGGKLDVDRREDLFLVFIDIFSVNRNRKLRPRPFLNFRARPWIERDYAMLIRISFLLLASSNLMNKCILDFWLQESEKIITTITFVAHLLKESMYAKGHQN